MLLFGAMETARLHANLRMSERHVRDGERHIARQKKLIEQMFSFGVDVCRYQDSLATFEETQSIHTEHVTKLKRQIIKASQT
jgi:hypothetical protein